MKSIKKFSTEMNQPKSILESIDSKALTELINGMGFKDIHELKKEKALLTKLEALLKEVTPVSEDDAAAIENKILKKAEPKSLESKTGEKEPEVAIGANGEVAEEEEPDVAEKDLEVAEEELEEESEVTPKATRKIMTFEDFIQEKTEPKEEVKEELEEEELEEVKEELEELEEELEEEELEETVTSNYSNNSVVKSFSQFVAESYISEKADNGPALQDEEIDYEGSIVLPIAKGDGPKSASNIEDAIVDMGEPKKLKDAEGETLVTDDQEIEKEPETAKDDVEGHGKVVVESTINEEDITSDEQFKEYAEAVLKKAFGDEYDEDKAQEVVDGLTSKYSGDYGAMIGALTSSLGEAVKEFVNEAAGFNGDLSKDDIEIPKFKLNLSKLKEIRNKIPLVYDNKEQFGLVNDYNAEAKKAFKTLLVAVDKLRLPEECGLKLEYSQNDKTLRNMPDDLDFFQGFLKIAWEYIPPRSRKKRWTSRYMYLSELEQGFGKAMDGGRDYTWAFTGEFNDEQLKDYLMTVYD